ncbi:MAG: restriction endonuclease subunit S [Deltaproteobacteria bacterium]|jgi:restriction endonuclease S subunit|nr:restriction endonuclease subunit S [Deltaproteobacteria bacterium]
MNSSLSLSPSSLKKGWQIVKFGEIAKNISKRVNPSETDLEVYVGLEHLDPQSLRITRHGVPSDVKGQKLRVRPGQIIFGKRRAYQKKVAVADFDGICSAHAMVLEAIPGKIIPELLPFFMQSDMFMDRAVAISEGSLSPTIKWKTLAIQEFPLPPLERQKKILEVLEKVEETVGLLNDLITSGNQVIESIVVDQFKASSEKLPLSDLCGEQRELLQPPFDKSQKYVGFEHINPVSIYLTSHGDIDNVVSAKAKFNKGNILYGKIRPYLRKVVIAPEGGLCSSDLIVLEVNSDISPVVVATILTSSYFSRIAMNSAKGTKMPRADWSVLKITKIPKIYKDKSDNFCKIFESVFTQKKIFEKKIKQLSRIRNSIA